MKEMHITDRYRRNFSNALADWNNISENRFARAIPPLERTLKTRAADQISLCLLKGYPLSLFARTFTRSVRPHAYNNIIICALGWGHNCVGQIRLSDM